MVTYTFDSYDLALEQAVELTRGVTGRIERLPETEGENGLRRRFFKILGHHKLIMVTESQIGDEVLSCAPGKMPTIVDVDRWG